MAQIFKRSANALALASIILGGTLVVGTLLLVFKLAQSPYMTDQGVVINQPVPFSHDHHTEVLGVHCGYCHTSVEKSAFAGIPPTETCMNCHKLIWNDSPMLEPIRASYRNNEPIRWERVNDLPDFVYFNHSIHVAKGMGCNTCHGQINEMPLVYQAETLQMNWCLDCHRNPEKYVRPREEVYNMNWELPAGVTQAELGAELVAEYDIQPQDTCSTCHR